MSVSQLAKVVKRVKVMWIDKYPNLDKLKKESCKNGMLKKVKQDEIFAGLKGTLGIPLNMSIKPAENNVQSKHLSRQAFELFIDLVHCPNPDLYYWQELYRELFKSSPPRTILGTVVNHMKSPEIDQAIGPHTNTQLFTALYRILDLKVGMAEVLLGTKAGLMQQHIPFSTEQRKCIEHNDCESFERSITEQGTNIFYFTYHFLFMIEVIFWRFRNMQTTQSISWMNGIISIPLLSSHSVHMMVI